MQVFLVTQTVAAGTKSLTTLRAFSTEKKARRFMDAVAAPDAQQRRGPAFAFLNATEHWALISLDVQ